MKKTEKKVAGVVKGGPSALVLSIVIHVVLFFLAGMLVVFTVVKKEDPVFEPPKTVERPKMKLKKPKVKIKKSSKPKSTAKIATNVRKSDMPVLDLPALGGMGTGLGGGFVLPGGTLYEGANGLALEAGHISVPFIEDGGIFPDCTCGLKGCMEAWVSLVALRRRLKLELRKQEWEFHHLNSSDATLEEKAFQLRTLAENGDALAIQLFKQQGYILGYGIADLVRVLDPGLVVIGGGLAEAKFRDQFLDWIREGFTERAWSVYRHSPVEPEKETTRFEWAEGGDAAASIGMAYTARELFA